MTEPLGPGQLDLLTTTLLVNKYGEFFDLLRAQFINVGFTGFDQPDSVFVHLLVVVRGVVQPIRPVKSQPANIFDD